MNENELNKPHGFVNVPQLVSGAIIGLVSTVIVLFATNAAREAEIMQLQANVAEISKKLDTKLDKLATKHEVDAAKVEAIAKSTRYTDSRMSNIEPTLARFTAILERLEKDAIDQRKRDDRLAEIVDELRAEVIRLRATR